MRTPNRYPAPPPFNGVLMSIPMYSSSVPVFRQLLGSLAGLLAKAETHATERKIDAEALLQARLFPDMFPFSRQVQIACDFARSVPARLAAHEVPSYDASPKTFAELNELIAQSLAFIDGLEASAFADSAQREIVLRPGTPKEKRLPGEAYLLNYGLPQFFFHVTTAYNLLRHNGVEVGKRDYMGSY
jgi:hypothetical protein